MLLIIVCGILLAVGVVLAVVWGGERLITPEFPPRGSADAGASAPRRHPHLEGLRYYLWWATVFIVIGTATGILVTGAGGRLAMRLLAVTSPDATGRFTEAQAIVGDITVEGTVAFLIFGALPFAFASAAVFLLVAPWLPRGRWAGPTFGAILLVTIGPFIDPLRRENIDFDRVGPGWLSVLLFAALAVLQGAALAALAGRLSRSLPLMGRRNWPATGVLLLPGGRAVPDRCRGRVRSARHDGVPPTAPVVPRPACVSKWSPGRAGAAGCRRAGGASGLHRRGGLDLGALSAARISLRCGRPSDAPLRAVRTLPPHRCAPCFSAAPRQLSARYIRRAIASRIRVGDFVAGRHRPWASHQCGPRTCGTPSTIRMLQLPESIVR